MADKKLNYQQKLSLPGYYLPEDPRDANSKWTTTDPGNHGNLEVSRPRNDGNRTQIDKHITVKLSHCLPDEPRSTEGKIFTTHVRKPETNYSLSLPRNTGTPFKANTGKGTRVFKSRVSETATNSSLPPWNTQTATSLSVPSRYSGAAADTPLQPRYSVAAANIPMQPRYSGAAADTPLQPRYSVAAANTPMQPRYSGAAADTPLQPRYSVAAANTPMQPRYSVAAADTPLQPRYSGAAANTPLQPRYSVAAADTPLQPRYSVAAADTPLQPRYSGAAADTPLQPRSSGAAADTPLQPRYSGAAADTPLQPRYSGAAADTPLQPRYSGAAADTPLQPRYSGATADTPLQPRYSGAAADTPLQPRYSGAAAETPLQPQYSGAAANTPVPKQSTASGSSDSLNIKAISISSWNNEADKNTSHKKVTPSESPLQNDGPVSKDVRKLSAEFSKLLNKEIASDPSLETEKASQKVLCTGWDEVAESLPPDCSLSATSNDKQGTNMLTCHKHPSFPSNSSLLYAEEGDQSDKTTCSSSIFESWESPYALICQKDLNISDCQPSRLPQLEDSTSEGGLSIDKAETEARDNKREMVPKMQGPDKGELEWIRSIYQNMLMYNRVIFKNVPYSMHLEIFKVHAEKMGPIFRMNRISMGVLVIYLQPEGATRAFSHQHELLGCKLRVLRPERPICKLFLTGLPMSTTDADIMRAISKFGVVLQLQRPTAIDGSRLPNYCFVSVDKEVACEILKAQTIQINSANIQVEVGKMSQVLLPCREDNTSSKVDNEDCKAELKDLPEWISHTLLKQYFSKYGRVCSVHVSLEKTYGHITFMTREALEYALSSQHCISGRVIHIARSVPLNHRIMLDNLSPFTSLCIVESEMKQYGEVVEVSRPSAKLPRGSPNTNRFCYVHFRERRPVELLLRQGEVVIDGKKIAVRRYER